MRIRRRETWTAAAMDVALVIVFVLIGRASHDAGDLLINTLWPFLVGLLAGWVVARAWRSARSLKTALVIWPVTVVAAMLLRVLSGQGTQLSFIVVTTLVLGVLLVGWRALMKLKK